ncbi:hypothetical protein DSO57_1001506 [Entomophthora muscae]|nr:hypothetical protein DSO57_1001506 [Entomophthora muscae]
MSCPQPPYEALNDVLVDFDVAWTQFEKDICFRYFGVGGFRTSSSNRPALSQLPPDSDMFIILITEAAHYAIERGILDCCQIDDCDPQAMIALPRLAIIAALSHMPSLLNITHPDRAFSWFQPYSEQLSSLRGRISALEQKEIELLERWLSFSETITETNTKLHHIYVEVASIADAFQSGEHASHLLLILKKVFTLSVPSSTPNIQLSQSIAIGHQKGAIEEILETGLSI